MDLPENTCPLCRKRAEIKALGDIDAYSFHCERCREFQIDKAAALSIIPQLQDGHLLSGLMRESAERHSDPPLLTSKNICTCGTMRSAVLCASPTSCGQDIAERYQRFMRDTHMGREIGIWILVAGAFQTYHERN